MSTMNMWLIAGITLMLFGFYGYECYISRRIRVKDFKRRVRSHRKVILIRNYRDS